MKEKLKSVFKKLGAKLKATGKRIKNWYNKPGVKEAIFVIFIILLASLLLISLSFLWLVLAVIILGAWK